MTSDSSTSELVPIIDADDSNTSTGPTNTSSGGSTNSNTSMAMADYVGGDARLVVGLVVESTIDVPVEGGPVPAL